MSLARVLDGLQTDLLGLQEVDYLLERSENENQVGEIAHLMETVHWGFAPSVIGSPDEQWRRPNRAEAKVITESDPGTPSYGIGLISKIPVLSWHRLELSPAPIGIFMKLPRQGQIKRIYVRDHPRVAIAAVLENGWAVVNTHLSFVPVFNYMQLLQVKRWTKSLPIKDQGKIIIMGDFNIRWSTAIRGVTWNSLIKRLTFPTWNPKVQIDYMLSRKVASEDVIIIENESTGLSDHLPISIEIDQ